MYMYMPDFPINEIISVDFVLNTIRMSTIIINAIWPLTARVALQTQDLPVSDCIDVTLEQ